MSNGLMDLCVSKSIVKYGNCKTKTGSQLNTTLDVEPLISSPATINYFSKLINAKTNHLDVEAFIGIDKAGFLIGTSLSVLYNKPLLVFENQKILGSRAFKKIIILAFQPNSYFKKTKEYLEKIGFTILSSIICFEKNRNYSEYFTSVIEYKLISKYKTLSFFHNTMDLMNPKAQKLAKIIWERKSNTIKKYNPKLKENYCCVYFDNLENMETELNTLKLYFKVFKTTPNELFNEIKYHYQYIDIIIIHHSCLESLMKIICKFPNNLGVIVYFDDEKDYDKIEFFNYYQSYKDTIIGILNLPSIFTPLINFSQHLHFQE